MPAPDECLPIDCLAQSWSAVTEKPWGNQRHRHIALGVLASFLVHTLIIIGPTEPEDKRPQSASATTALLRSSQPLARERFPTKTLHGSAVTASPQTLNSPSAALDAPPPESSGYFGPEQLDEQGTPIEPPWLPPPENLSVRDGQLLVKIYIDENGEVADTELLDSTFTDDYTEVLVRSFRETRFSPSIRSGIPVKSWKLIEISYSKGDW